MTGMPMYTPPRLLDDPAARRRRKELRDAQEQSVTVFMSFFLLLGAFIVLGLVVLFSAMIYSHHGFTGICLTLLGIAVFCYAWRKLYEWLI